MIAKGNLHANGGKLAAYLTTGNEQEGERAELVELRGFAADNIFDAFTDVQIQAEATRCTKPFFHAYVRLPEGETLAREQWLKVADRLEKGLGFEGQGRAIAFHHLADGTTHMHVAWSRIDLETMRAIDPGLYKNKLKEMSRDLEKEFGLTQVRDERDPEQKARAAGRNEFEQSRRLDTDIKAIRETIRGCWDHSDNGRSFEAALRDKGMVLARGDRRDFVVIDHDGGTHALSKRITGATAAETRARLSDLDRESLPRVTSAQRAARARPAPARATSPRTSERAGREPAMSRGAKSAASNTIPRASAQPTPPGRERTGRAATKVAAKVASGILGGVSKFADAIATGFEQLLGGGPSVPPPQLKTEDRRPMPEPKEATPHEQVVSAEEARAVRRQALMEKYGGEIEPNREAEIAAGVRKRDEDRSR
jgi:hypothetical protein